MRCECRLFHQTPGEPNRARQAAQAAGLIAVWRRRPVARRCCRRGIQPRNRTDNTPTIAETGRRTPVVSGSARPRGNCSAMLRESWHNLARKCARGFQDLWRGQHAAWKYIALYEVDLAAVALEHAVLDGDGLDPRKPAGQQAIAQLREVFRPELLADRLDHLDRRDPVILVTLVAVILQPDLDLVRKARFVNALLRKIALLPADRQSDDVRSKGLRNKFGKAAPPATDLQQLLPRPQVDCLREPAIFVVLRRGEISRVILEQRRGIGHAGIEP